MKPIDHHPSSGLNVQKVASVFGVDETEIVTGRMEQREQERQQFLNEALTDEARLRIAKGEVTLDAVLLGLEPDTPSA